MYTGLPLRSAPLRLFQFLLLAVLLLGRSVLAPAQTIVYGLGTVVQTIPSGNLFYPNGAAIGDQGILPIDAVSGRPTVLPIQVTGYVNTVVSSPPYPQQLIVGMDFRPSNGRLYALGYFTAGGTSYGQLYTLVPTTGVLTPVGTATPMQLGSDPVRIGFDFNPVADLIRVVSPNRQNYRLSPTTGAIVNIDTNLAYAATDPRSAVTPGIGTAAYSNSFIGSTSTTLYDIDELNGAILVRQDPPNAGTLNSIAPITNPGNFVNFSRAQGLDIDISHNSGTDIAYLIEVSDPNGGGFAATNIQSINLSDGTVSNRKNVIPQVLGIAFNVYEIAVPMPDPRISVQQAGILVANGGTFAGFPSTQVGSTSAPVTFTITNTSTTDALSLLGITTTGEFALSGSAPTSVAPNSTATFSLTFSPTAGGTRTGSVRIANNSQNDNPYVITLNGQGLAPNPLISVSQAGTPIPNGGSYSGFANTAPGSTSPAVTFTINNTSTTDVLNLGAFTIAGPFALSGTAPTTVPAGGSVTFDLTFAPTSTGANSGSLSIANNSQTNNPYVINLSGTGTGPVDLVVSTTQAVTGTYRNVTILGANPNGSGVANLTGPLTYSGALVVQSGGVLFQNCQPITGAGSFELQAGAAIAICDPAGITPTGNPTGAVQVTGTRSFSPGASYLYNNNTNTPQVTGSGLPSQVLNLGVQNSGNVTLSQAVSVAQVLRLQLGNLNTNSQTLTLLSSAAGTALVDNRGGVVNGTATVQRYIASSNPVLGYRHYSSPVMSTTVSDLATSGFSPVVNPAYNMVGNTAQPFPNVYSYDETFVNVSTGANNADFDKGWRSPNSTGEVLAPTRGYTVNINYTETVDFVGTLNNGPLAVGGLSRGSQTMSGYHLRGNPYPSPLNWASMLNNGRVTGIENALYVFKSSGQYTGSYASFVNGQATNTGSNILPLGQGFLVRTTAGQTGNINFNNADRVTDFDATPFQRGTVDARPQLTLALENATARTQAVVYFEAGATAGFDRAFDARTLPSPNGLTLATETTAGEPLAISGLPILTGADVLLPLDLATATAGTYSLSVDNLANIPANYHAYLRDALTSTYTDLATTPALSLNLAANGAAGGRYAVLFTTQLRVLSAASTALAKLASIYPNPAHGTATLLLPLALRGNQATAVSVVDNLGRTVLTRTLAAGSTETLELPLTSLAPGVYSVQAHTAAGLVAKRLVVQ